ncbi:hypothetical protein OIH86_12220 [Metabacillus halosaccharovorans]|uniref:Uncharacterized protein n=2 Tax=Metabacillus TaxID=2675233 RepID=A0ABT3DHM5_9BACI|nr:hypothetical protein [Metabacillus halosaccharovorans]MCV9886404.1 hypothetical protein [Metabacillus halosaccharovorans]
MKIIHHSYRRRGQIEFMFEEFPHSKVVFSPIKNYYFIRTVRWNREDPVVTRRDLEKMELEVNEFLGSIECYKQRKAYKSFVNH